MTADAAMPPKWAEILLGFVLKTGDRETVSGDLLEEYRESIVPARGLRAADLWYVRQVAGFVWRTTWRWALFFAAAFLARTAFDWFMPPRDFYVRSVVTTYLAIATLISLGFWAAWRSASFVAGVLVTVMTSQIAAVMKVVGAAILLAIWHDRETMNAIAGSGGIGEVFELPFIMAIPAVILGTIGGAAGRVSRRLLRA